MDVATVPRASEEKSLVLLTSRSRPRLTGPGSVGHGMCSHSPPFTQAGCLTRCRKYSPETTATQCRSGLRPRSSAAIADGGPPDRRAPKRWAPGETPHRRRPCRVRSPLTREDPVFSASTASRRPAKLSCREGQRPGGTDVDIVISRGLSVHPAWGTSLTGSHERNRHVSRTKRTYDTVSVAVGGDGRSVAARSVGRHREECQACL